MEVVSSIEPAPVAPHGRTWFHEPMFVDIL
jgi:hypothetical protein